MSEARKRFQQLADEIGDLPSVLAVGSLWEFDPQDCTIEYLVGFIEGRYDSMNEGNEELVRQEKILAREELVRRGVLA